jgi:hypothetical protein
MLRGKPATLDSGLGTGSGRPNEECHAAVPDDHSPDRFDGPSMEAFRVARSLALAEEIVSTGPTSARG